MGNSLAFDVDVSTMAADGVEDPMSVANAIGDCVLTDRIKKEQFQVKTLWKDQRVVLHVMRRFG